MFWSYSLLVCYLDDQVSAMGTVSARVQLGSASTITDFWRTDRFITFLLCCLCSFAVVLPTCMFRYWPLLYFSKCYQRGNKHIIITWRRTDWQFNPWCRPNLASLSYSICQGISLSKEHLVSSVYTNDNCFSLVKGNELSTLSTLTVRLMLQFLT